MPYELERTPVISSDGFLCPFCFDCVYKDEITCFTHIRKRKSSTHIIALLESLTYNL